MRHTRARRRFKIILIILFTVSFVFFLETKVESFAPQLKVFAESRIEHAFNERFKISIGSLDGGIFRPLILNDVKIKDKRGAELFSFLAIKNIRSNFHIWDAVFKKREAGSILYSMLSTKPWLDINFAMVDKSLKGFIRLEGDNEGARLRGYATVLGKDKIELAGRLEDDSFRLDLKPSHGSVKIEGLLPNEDGEFTLNVMVNHLTLWGYDLVCEAVLKDRINTGPSDTDYLDGEIESRNFVLNYKPFLDIRASYRISKKGVLDISNFELGKDFKIRGKVLLRQPYNIDIVLLANNANLNLVLSTFNIADDVPISGTMNGKFEFKGPFKNSSLDANIDIKHGNIGTIDFDSLTATLKGEGPLIRIEDSRITRPSGYFALAGEIDLRRAGKGNIFEGVRMATDETAIIWDGMDNRRMIGDVQELKMKKKVSEIVNLGFTKFIADDKKVDESLRDKDELELEYKLHPNESLKMSIGQDTDFFGLEHKDKF